MVYSRFSDKNELFRTVVEEGAEKLYGYFCSVQEEFASFSAERQRTEMHCYVYDKADRMVEIIYEYFDTFKLFVCKSAGSCYEYYIDKMVDIETDSTKRFVALLKSYGIEVREVRADLSHMLASAMFHGMFEVVAHDFSKDDAVCYVRQLQDLFNAGWDRLLGS